MGNQLKALLYILIIKDFVPLIGVPHIRQCIGVITAAGHSGKLPFKGRADGIGRWTVVSGAEIEKTAMPFGKDVHQVIEPRALRRRLDLCRFQIFLYPSVGPGFQGRFGLR